MNYPAKLNFDDLLKKAKKVYHTPQTGQDCPSAEILIDYVHRQLSEEISASVTEHLKQCQACRVKILKMDIERIEWDYMLEQGLQAVLEDMGWDSESTPKLPDLREGIAQYFWEIEETGQILTGKTPAITKEKTFDTEIGRITITCAWGDAVDGEPAFLWLSWETELTEERDFLIQLINPDTQGIRFTISPEIIKHESQRTFKQDELGFDPVREKWAIAISIFGKR